MQLQHTFDAVHHAREARLISNAVAGSSEAFCELVEIYYSTVYGVALARLGEHEAAEELAQEVFLRAFLQLHKLRDHRVFCAWLLRITRNLSANWIKAHQRASSLVKMISLEEAHMELPDRTQPRVWERISEREEKERLRGAVMELPVDLREVIIFHYIEGVEKSEIARRLGVHPSSVGRKLERAVDALRRSFPLDPQTECPAFRPAMPVRSVPRLCWLLWQRSHRTRNQVWLPLRKILHRRLFESGL